jgi:hypothetical protein
VQLTTHCDDLVLIISPTFLALAIIRRHSSDTKAYLDGLFKGKHKPLKCFIRPIPSPFFTFGSRNERLTVYEDDGTIRSTGKKIGVVVGLGIAAPLFLFLGSLIGYAGAGFGVYWTLKRSFAGRIARGVARRAAVQRQEVLVPAVDLVQEVAAEQGQAADADHPQNDQAYDIDAAAADNPQNDQAYDIEAALAARRDQVPPGVPEAERPSLSRAQIDKLVGKMPTAGDGNGSQVCCVCLEDGSGDTARRSRAVALPACDHYFHSDCIGLWLGRGKTDCPICQRDVLGLEMG